MPLSLVLSDTELLLDIGGVLLHTHMEATRRQMEIRERLRDQPFVQGDLRGHVASVGDAHLTVRLEGGGTKEVPLTRRSARQLLAMSRK